MDNTFSNDGKEILNFGYEYSSAFSVAIQNNGKIVTVGTVSHGHTGILDIARYNNNGSLDNSFSGDGKQTSDSDLNGSKSVAIQKDGKIVIAGDLYILRYNSDGSPDNTFDNDGISSNNFLIYDITLESNGKIVAAGSSIYSDIGHSNFKIARFNTDGSPDNTFNGNGSQSTNFNDASSSASAVSVQSDGKILAAGQVYTKFGVTSAALARYNSDGSLDSSFSNV